MNITVEAQPYEDDYKYYKDLIAFMKERGRSKFMLKIVSSMFLILGEIIKHKHAQMSHLETTHSLSDQKERKR